MRRSSFLVPPVAAALLGVAACAGQRGAPREAARVADPHAAHAAHGAPAAKDTSTVRPAGDGFSLYDLPSDWRDQRGAEVRLPSLAGKVRVVAMVYTSCQATCPLIVGDLRRRRAAPAMTAPERPAMRGQRPTTTRRRGPTLSVLAA